MGVWGERGGVDEQPCEGGRVTPPPGAGLELLLLRRVVAIIAAAKAIGICRMRKWWSGSSVRLRSAVRKKAGRIVVSRNVIPHVIFVQRLLELLRIKGSIASLDLSLHRFAPP